MIPDKHERQNAIREIVRTSTVTHQEDFLQLLRERGFEITQATLSRDLRELKIAKTPDPSGNYIYRLPLLHLPETDTQKSGIITPFQRSGVLYMDFSGKNIVIKTPAGYAEGVAADILFNNIPGIITAIPHYDTIILYLRENADNMLVLNSIKILFAVKNG